MGSFHGRSWLHLSVIGSYPAHLIHSVHDLSGWCGVLYQYFFENVSLWRGSYYRKPGENRSEQDEKHSCPVRSQYQLIRAPCPRTVFALKSLKHVLTVFMTLHKFPMIKYTDLKFRTWEVSQTSSNMAWNIASEQKITNNLVTERKHTSILRIPWGRNDITASLNSNIASISFP